MRVGLVIERFDPFRGGAEQWAYQHAVGLAQHGHEVHIVAAEIGTAVMGEPFSFHTFAARQSRLERAAAAERVLQALHLDIVHDIGLGWHSDILQSEDGSRLAQWEHKLLTLPAWARSGKRQLMRLLPRYTEIRRLTARQLADPERLIVAVSKMCMKHYQDYHDLPADRLRLVYHGTNTRRFSPDQRTRFRERVREQWQVRPDEVLFLFVGHDFRRKGLLTAKRAVAHLAREGLPARLMVVGHRKEKKLNPAGPHRRHAPLYTGRVRDPVPYYSAADVFVLPTFYDPCSLSVGEAAACGLPVVTTRVNGASELLTHGHDGMVLDDPADDVMLSRYLLKLMEPQLRLRMGLAARRTSLQYSLERNYREIYSLYAEVVQRRDQRIIPFEARAGLIAPRAGRTEPRRRAA